MTLIKIPASYISILLSALLFSACATPINEHYYRLTYASGIAELYAPKYELVVNQVQIPEAINRPQMVLQKSPTESLVKEEQRWVAPLDEQMTHAMVANLRNVLPETWLTEGLESKANLPRFLLKIQIHNLLIDAQGKIELETTWLVMDVTRTVLRRQHKTIVIPLATSGYDSIAVGVSEAMRQLSAAIAEDVTAVQKK